MSSSPSSRPPIRARSVFAILTSVLLVAIGIFFATAVAHATSNHSYKPGEFGVIVDGLSPDGHYSIAAHGEGDFGYSNFHLYLMDARTGGKIGPLEEIKDTLDTGASAFYAHWSADSHQVAIRYRVDRHEAMEVRYRIADHRARLIAGPSKVPALRFTDTTDR